MDVIAKDAHKILRTGKLAVVPKIHPFFLTAILFVMANISTLEEKPSKHRKYVACVQMP